MNKRLSPEELLEIFRCLDKDGSGVISRNELENGLSSAGVHPKSIKNAMDKLDLNQDGYITLAEYKLAMGLTNEPMAEWKRLFISMDQDRSGNVDKHELQKMFQELNINFSLEILEEWIADHDVDGDGMLSYREFLGFIAEQAD